MLEPGQPEKLSAPEAEAPPETPEQKIARLEEEIKRLQEKNQQLESENQALREKNQQLERLALEDPVTKLPNRRAIEQQLERRVAEVKRNGGKLVILVIDIDGFKQVNDQYGHSQGDVVLNAVARMLEKTGRGSDIFGRLGGDEIVGLLPLSSESELDIEEIKEALKRFNENAKEINRSGSPDNLDPQTLSIGGVVIDYTISASWQDVLAAADKNLYFSKNQGRDRSTLTIFSATHNS